VAAVVAGLWLWMEGREGPPSPLPSASPSVAVVEPTPAPTPAVAAGTGTLIVDALPWGEVLEVADAKGVAQALPENRFTPVALSLPPGEYRLRVRPPKGEPRSLTVTVRASGAETELVEFGRVDAAAYLRKSGL
jgi:hypothetical protein